MSGRTALAVLGEPLRYTQTPALHRAGLEALGIEGDSEALRTTPADLRGRLADLAARGYRGVNLTSPLKEAVLEHLDRVSGAARAARSVNTVGFEPDGWWGDTTDGPGLVDLLGAFGRDVKRERALLLGAGGAARSVALALAAAGAASVAASARNPEAARAAWKEIPGAALVGWRSREESAHLGEATLVIHATPLGGEPVSLERVSPRALILDLVYGAEPTPWVQAARARGQEAYDGLGLLVFQARRSLALWFARAVPVDPLARAVGWPR